MRPGFLDAVAFAIAAAISSFSLFLANEITTLQAQQRRYQQQGSPWAEQFQNPFGRPSSNRQESVRPPSLPAYTMQDCYDEVELSSDHPLSDYKKRYCECYTPRRVKFGPKHPKDFNNLTAMQVEERLTKFVEEDGSQCERYAINSFADSSNISRRYSSVFMDFCQSNPIQFFGEKSKLGKNQPLCECVRDNLKSDQYTITAITVGAGRISSRPAVLDKTNACLKKVFPPPAQSGWQIEEYNGGEKVAFATSDDDPLISRLELSCNSKFKLRLRVNWRRWPAKQQLFFSGGEDLSDVIIPLRGGIAEGEPAKAFYDQLVFIQKIWDKNHVDPDITPMYFQSEEHDIPKGGIILGNSIKRLAPVIEACLQSRPPSSNMNKQVPNGLLQSPTTRSEKPRVSCDLNDLLKVAKENDKLVQKDPSKPTEYLSVLCARGREIIRHSKIFKTKVEKCGPGLLNYDKIRANIANNTKSVEKFLREDCKDY